MYAGVHSLKSHDCQPPFDVLAIASSAGGITALKTLLSGLPREFPSPILIVQHLPSKHQFRSRLPEVLRRSTVLPVKWAEQFDRLQPGTVYVAPQDQHMKVLARRIYLCSSERINGVRPAADPLFSSLADQFGERAVCVVLTGALSDGAKGAKRVADAGGRVLTQDQATSDAFGMPSSAIRTRRVDFVLPLAVIAKALIVLFMVKGGAAWFQVKRSIVPVPEEYPSEIRDPWSFG